MAMTAKKLQQAQYVALLRISFGVVWAIDAFFKWRPSFQNGFADDVMMAAQGQPHWLTWFFNLGMNAFMQAPHFFAFLVALLETAIALSLLLGFGQKVMYVVGIIFALMIWAIGEGFGGPYGPDSTDIGSAIMYVGIFSALILLNRETSSAWSLDALIRAKRKRA